MTKRVMMRVSDQNKNSIVKALASTDIIFTQKAMRSGLLAKEESTAPIIWKRGAPGGCPTCNLAEVAMYSLQSQ